MGFFSKLFGKKPTTDWVARINAPPEPTFVLPGELSPPKDLKTIQRVLEDTPLKPVAALVAKAAQPGLMVRPKPADQEALLPTDSRFGGRPHLPPGFEWPMLPVMQTSTFDNHPKHPVQLEFYAQINCAEIAALLPEIGFPSEGQLYFWQGHDEIFDAWDHPEGYRVAYGDSPELKIDTEGRCPFPCFKLEFAHCFSISEESEEVSYSALNAALKDESLVDEYYDQVPCWLAGLTHDEMNAGQYHQIGGAPSIIQGGYEEKGQVLLLQLDSDDRLNWCFGDAGRYWFYIDANDLKNKKFEETQFLFECH